MPSIGLTVIILKQFFKIVKYKVLPLGLPPAFKMDSFADATCSLPGQRWSHISKPRFRDSFYQGKGKFPSKRKGTGPTSSHHPHGGRALSGPVSAGLTSPPFLPPLVLTSDTRLSVFGCQLFMEVVWECQLPQTWKLWGLWDGTASWALVLCILVYGSEAAYKLHTCARTPSGFWMECIESVEHLRKIISYSIKFYPHYGTFTL